MQSIGPGLEDDLIEMNSGVNLNLVTAWYVRTYVKAIDVTGP